MALDCGTLWLNQQYGSMDFNISGKSIVTYIYAGSYGAFNCLELKSYNTFIRSDGSNDCYVNAVDWINGEIRSVGNIYYTGNPVKEDVVKNILLKEHLGLDVVFECCGMQGAFDNACDILKPGGKLVVVGIPEFERWTMDVETTRRREISLQFIRRQVDCLEPALEMMKNGKIDVKNMVTHRFPFSKTNEAFDLVADYKDGVMKAMIDF